jgi:hypothetical protein
MIYWLWQCDFRFHEPLRGLIREAEGDLTGEASFLREGGDEISGLEGWLK